MISRIFPFDELSALDRDDAAKARARGEPIAPPTGKPSSSWTESERRAVELRAKRQREESARVDAALTRLDHDAQRDQIVRQAVSAIQSAGIPALVEIGDTTVALAAPLPGEKPLSLEDLATKIDHERTALPNEQQPGWWSKFWDSLRAGVSDSVEAKIKLEIGLMPVSAYAAIDLVKFAKGFSRQWQGHHQTPAP
ncbi:hypothetical protein [Mesorhizobium sp. M0088]|uniref:hypothetical protein n=1 Tax=Mesorhizobium sp. M0088 TaxID=2956873 RepID=UPI003334C1A0